MKNLRLLPLLPILLLAAFVSTPLAAQDVTCQPAALVETSDKPDTPPVLKEPCDIEYPAALAKAGTQGYAIAVFTTPSLSRYDREKYNPYLHVVGTDITIEENVRDFFLNANGTTGRGLKYPASLNKKRAKSYSWSAVIFNPTSAAADNPNATVRLLKVAPVFVKAAQWDSLSKKEKVLRGSIAIDASGKPGQITLETKSASAQALLPDMEKSVAQWSFAPARVNGQPVDSVIKTIFVPLTVPDTINSIPSNYTLPKPIKQGNPVYPRALKKQGLTGTVTVSFYVNKKGDVEDVKTVAASNMDFSNAAMDAVKKWKYKQGMADGAPIKTNIQQQIEFNLSDSD